MFSSESGRPSRSSITCVGSRERVAAVERIKDDVDAPLHHRPQTFDRARRHGLEKQRLEAIMIVVVAVEEPAVRASSYDTRDCSAFASASQKSYARWQDALRTLWLRCLRYF